MNHPANHEDGGMARRELDSEKSEANVLPPRPEVKLIARFLRKFGRRSPTLAFIDRTGNAKYTRITRRYPTPTAAAHGAAHWNDEGRCAYFVGNSHRLPRLNERGRTDTVRAPGKADIELAVGVWLDVDDPDPTIVPELTNRLDWGPAYVIFTGGGYQAHWRFEQPTADIDAAEACALGMIRDFGDLPGLDRSCWSADHLWRLPGTVNRKRGVPARMLHADWSSRLPMAEVEPETRPAETLVSPVSFSVDGFTLDTIRQCLSHEAWDMLVRRPSHLPSRSEHQFAFIAAVLNDGTSQERIDLCAACLLATPADERSVSHASYWDAGGKPRAPEAHVSRQITNWLRKNGGQDESA